MRFVSKEEAMQAVRFVGVGRTAQIEDIRKPSPDPGQVLIKIGGAGVCHSDLHVMEEDLGFKPPFTLGHENAGWVAAAGNVLDCVGVQPTLDLGAKLLGRNSVWTIVGLGGGRHDFRHGSTPYGTSMSIPYWGSRVELMEVIAMAGDGRIHAETTEFPLADAVDVYARLKAGQISGRAVLVPQ
jgi:D-arabinose 1-dehydrogenase-like Zn-dependent alcohol dehydrogenase